MTLDEDLAKRIAEDAVLSRVLAKADSGTADFTDTSRYHDRMAEIVGAVMREHVLEVPAESRSALCERVLRDRYRDSAELLSRVQEALDAALGIRLAPQIPEFQTERVRQIGHSLEDATAPDEKIQRRAESASANVVRAFQDRYVQENARFRSDAGLKCWIVRDAGAKCCDWCAGIDGKYEYGSEPKDVYGRHDNCTCTVTYENGRKRQDVWSKRTWEQPEPGAGAGEPVRFSEKSMRGGADEPARLSGANTPNGFRPTVFTPEQAAAVEQFALTGGAERDRIDAADSRDDSMARRIYNAMTPEQRAEVIMRGIREPEPTFSHDSDKNNAMKYLRKTPPLPFVFDVRSHGNPKSMEFFKDEYPKDDPRALIDAYTLAMILRGREDFQAFLEDCAAQGKSQAVRLLSCSTGRITDTANCFAQLLANELGMMVYAPTDIIYAFPNGYYEIGKINDGEMKPFWGRK